MLARLKSFFNPTDSDSDSDSDEPRLLRRIFWTGFLVRVLYLTLAHTYRIKVTDDHFEFGWEMGRIARSLATGHGFANPFNGPSGPTAWTPPLYPLLLAGVFRLFGVYTRASGWVILTVDSAFSAATATAIYRIARRCFGRAHSANPSRKPGGLNVALWSAWLWALYPAAMQYAVKWVWDMSLTAFLFTWVLVAALRIRGVGDAPRTSNPEPRTSLWLLFGALWGLIALSNSSLLTFLPACGLWIVWPGAPFMRSHRMGGVAGAPFMRSHRMGGVAGAPFMTRSGMGGVAGAPFMRFHRMGGVVHSLAGPTLAALCFAAVISPWAIRNWEVFHAFVPMRSNFGAELYEAAIFSNDGLPEMATLDTPPTAPEFRRYVRLGEVEYSRQQGERARAAIRAHPGLFAANTLRRVYFFWIGVPKPGTGVAVEAARRINFAFFSLSGFLGLALALRRHVPAAWLFFWAFAVYPILYYFVTVQARFRHPLEPIVCILSVYLFQSADRTQAFARLKQIRNLPIVPITTAAAKRESSGRPSPWSRGSARGGERGGSIPGERKLSVSPQRAFPLCR